MFVLAAAFGAAALLGRRRLELREPVLYAAPAAGIVLLGLSLAAERSLSRWAGVLLAVLFVPYLAWVLLEPQQGSPGRTPERPDVPADPPPAATGESEPVAVADAPMAATAVVDRGSTAGGTAEGGTAIGGGAIGGGAARGVLRALAGAAVVVGGAFALSEGTTRVLERAPLAPGFAGAAIAGSLAALPYALLVLFPRRAGSDVDPGEGAMTVLAGLISLVPGVAAIVRPFELDGPAAVCVLAVALLYAVAGAWMLLRGRSDRFMGAVVLLVYAACLVVAGSL
jgi:Ca2+/Na+ antiporter